MPIFITQGRYTEHALKGMMASPEDRESRWPTCSSGPVASSWPSI